MGHENTRSNFQSDIEIHFRFVVTGSFLKHKPKICTENNKERGGVMEYAKSDMAPKINLRMYFENEER